MDRSWLRKHLPELLILCISLGMLFVKLGIGEFESSDEALYIVRAEAAVKFDAWIDQSDYALGGFYSATHPPLGIWLIAASRAAFGDSEFATRLPSALAGVVACLGLLVLLRRFTSDRTAILLSAAFAACTLFSWYARHAQLDSLLIALGIWSLVYLYKSLDKQSLQSAVISGILLGLALMSKFVWGLFVVPYILLVVSTTPSQIRYRSLLLMLGMALAIAMPWYLYMILEHPEFLTHAQGVGTVSGYESGADKSIIYYLNQLIVNCPFIVFGLLLLWKERRSSAAIMVAMWFAVLLLALQVMPTKMPHFALLLLPAAFLLAGVVLEKRSYIPTWMWTVLTLTILWSLSSQVRLLIRGVEFNYRTPDLELIVAGAVALVAIVLLGRKGRSIGDLAMLSLAGVFVIAAAVKVLNYTEEVFTDGAKEIGKTLRSNSRITNLVALHSSLHHENLTPRLAYYTDGWTAGWLPGKRSSTLEWDDENLADSLNGRLDNHTAIVIERDWDRFYTPPQSVVDRMIELRSLLRVRFSNYDSLRSYDLFY